MKNQYVRDQHTVSKCLLKWFSDDGVGLNEYSLTSNTEKRRNLGKATVQKYFYDTQNLDGSKNQSVAHRLASPQKWHDELELLFA